MTAAVREVFFIPRLHVALRCAALILPLLLGACAASNRPSAIRPGVVAATCADQAQCVLYWTRAREWIAQNSKRPVTSVTEWMLETASPGHFDASLTFHLTRWPGPQDSGEIRFEAYCSTLIPCSPGKSEAYEDFKRYIIAAP
jgi:hypothetical protein